MTPEIAEKLDKHFSQYPLRKYSKKQILIFAGDEPRYVFYLVKGKVRQYDVSYRGDEVVVNIYHPPAFFPMLWAINSTPNRYIFDAETDVEVRLSPVNETIEFLKANSDVMYDLLSRLYIGVDGLLGRVVHLMSGSAHSRLLYELLIECRRFGKQQKDDSWSLEIHEVDLASRAGLSRETISREMHKIKELGLVEVGKRGIVIKDLTALQKKLGTEL